MPFKKNFEQLRNQLAFVVPQHGYGWQRTEIDTAVNNPAPAKPWPFRMVMTDFLETENICSVILGRIAEKDHPLNDWWVAIIAMGDDISFDLTSEKIACFTLICPEKPTFNSTFRPTNHAKVVSTESLPRYRGISLASKSMEALEEEIKSYSQP